MRRDPGEAPQREKNLLIAQITMNTGRQPLRSLEAEDRLNIDAVHRLLLMRKARELGIRASDEDVIRQIRAQPILRNEQGQFDPGRYQRFMIYLNNLGVSESLLEEIMREQVVLARLRALVTDGLKVTPTEMSLYYTPLHEQATIDYVEFDVADYKEPIEINENEVRTYYDQNREALRKPAQVKVRYVYFTVTDAKKSLTLSDNEIAEYYERNKDKYVDAEKKPKPLAEVKDEVRSDLLDLRAERLAGDRATSFSVKLVQEPGAPRPDFVKIAAEFGVTPHETGFFSAGETVPGIEADRQFDQAALALGPDMLFSDPVRGKDGYYVLEYLDGKPSRIPSFEEAKQEVIDRLKQRAAYEAIVKRGREDATKVQQAVAAGKSFSAACAELGLQVKTAPPFTAVEEVKDLPAARTVQEVALGMATNSVSEFIPFPTGGLFFHLKGRTPPNPENFEKDKPLLERQLLDRDREALFTDWVNSLIIQERVDYKPQAPPPTRQGVPEETEPAEEPAPAKG
jgi:peptidyl-prolyl cis-trans isomerase D